MCDERRWRVWLGFALLGAMVGASAAEANDAEELRLRKGTILYVEILDSSEDGLRVKRLDDGGVIHLYWDHLAEVEAKRLRRQLGYDFDEGEQVMVDAVRVRFRTGNDRVGVIVAEDDRTITLADGETRLPIDRSRIREIEPIRVPANEVYEIEDLYREKLAAMDSDSASDHFELANYLRKLDAWNRAKIHLERARELDPDFETETITNLLETIQPFVENQKYLDEVNTAMRLASRKQYQECITALKGLIAAAPTPALKTNVEERIVSVQERENAYISNYVEKEWWDTIKRLIDDRVGDRLLQLKEAQTWATKSLGDETAEKMAQRLGVDARRVREVWSNRSRSKIERANYTSGTFILGDKALVVYDDNGQPVKSSAEARRAMGATPGGSSESFQRRLQEYFKSSGRQAQSQEGRADSDPDAWWNEQKSSIRSQWLRAYYGEFSGDMKVVRVQFNYSRDHSLPPEAEEQLRQQREQQARNQNRGRNGRGGGAGRRSGQNDQIRMERFRLERTVYFR